ncbi:MAG: Nudix hydrolase 3 [Candidatus Kapaibacterium sp.]|nr:MAG: Nudix hydrolase 3 [Candidatus Kapabacteria bacterium]
MKKIFFLLFVLTLFGCKEKVKETVMEKKEALPPIEERIKAFAPVTIEADLSHLTERERKVVELLVEAGQLADAIFWKQTAPDAIAVRDSLAKLGTEEARKLLKLVNIFYGPYDLVYEGRRFVGNGPEVKPQGANFYPLDLTKEEFEKYIQEHPEQKAELESQYTIIVRDGNKLKAIPYHQAYPEVEQIARKLEEAADFCDNPTLRNYLILRAKALRTDDYFESDMAWMDIKGSKIDVVIGPIENYEDALFNYKTAYEAIVMVKDEDGTKELEMFEKNLDHFEHNLPYDKKYIRKTAGKGNVLQIMNVVYFGGDCQAGTKTIANSLPNDPKVHELKGGKKSMFKNMMEAKFDKILKPIGERILEPNLVQLVDKKSFTSFVTLHEVSHTLGRGFVYGNDTLPVRKALKERYSAIEECKADVLGMYNHKYLFEKGLISKDDFEKAKVTYIAGLFRSIRFGAEEAHGKANLIQLNFLEEKGIIKYSNGKICVDLNNFIPAIQELAKIVLTIQAEGDYVGAGRLLEKYGKMKEETKKIIDSLNDIPRDIDTEYAIIRKR